MKEILLILKNGGEEINLFVCDLGDLEKIFSSYKLYVNDIYENIKHIMIYEQISIGINKTENAEKINEVNI